MHQKFAKKKKKQHTIVHENVVFVYWGEEGKAGQLSLELATPVCMLRNVCTIQVNTQHSFNSHT